MSSVSFSVCADDSQRVIKLADSMRQAYVKLLSMIHHVVQRTASSHVCSVPTHFEMASLHGTSACALNDLCDAELRFSCSE